MNINEISDFYDCLSPGTKKEISKLYGVKQLTLKQKRIFIEVLYQYKNTKEKLEKVLMKS